MGSLSTQMQPTANMVAMLVGMFKPWSAVKPCSGMLFFGVLFFSCSGSLRSLPSPLLTF